MPLAREWPRDVLLSFNISPVQLKDRSLGLKLLAALPPGLAKWGIRLRGCAVFALDLEWRALSLGQSPSEG